MNREHDNGERRAGDEMKTFAFLAATGTIDRRRVDRGRDIPPAQLGTP